MQTLLLRSLRRGQARRRSGSDERSEGLPHDEAGLSLLAYALGAAVIVTPW